MACDIDSLELHDDTKALVHHFAFALAEKLAAAEKKYGYSNGWQRADWMDECREHLRRHVEKGDPRDVAAYCAFLWHHNESTATPPTDASGGVTEPLNELLMDAIDSLDEGGFKDVANRLHAQFDRIVAADRARKHTPTQPAAGEDRT